MKQCVACVLALGTLAASAELPEGVIYRNDFTTRESSGAIPRLGETYTAQPYSTSNKKLYPYRDTALITKYASLGLELNGVYSYLNFAPMYCADVGDSRPSYDGWFEPYFAVGKATSSDNLFLHSGTVYYEPDAEGKSNPCFRYYYSPGSSATRTGLSLKSLHNVFTNGQLKLQFDLKFAMLNKSSKQFWVFPVYDKYMDIEAWGGTIQVANASPGLVGFRSGTDRTKPYPQYYDSQKKLDGTTQLGNTYSGGNRTLWGRYEVTYDLDSGKFSGGWKALYGYVSADVWSNATACAQHPHPTFETEIPESPVKSSSFSKKSWLGAPTDLPALWAEKGGVSGLGIFFGNVTGKASEGCGMDPGGIGTSVIDRPEVDNILVSWKAPGSADFAMVYKDDFSTRTYCVLSAPQVATSGAYAATTEETGKTIDTFTGYVAGKTKQKEDGYDLYALVPTAVKPYGTAVQPLGVDGWRRINPTDDVPRGRPWTQADHDSGEGGTVMSIGANSQCGCFAQLIGDEITSGKVKISVDAHLPSFASDFTWLDNKLDRVAVALGPKALHSSVTAEIVPNTAAGAGVWLDETTEGDKAVYTYKAFVNGGDGTLIDDPSVEFTKNSWYRLEVTADLDAKTYDVTVTPLGTLSVGPDFVPTNDVVKTVTGVPFANGDISSIGAFYLWGFGYGGTLSSSKAYRTCFDNIRVWKVTPPAEPEGMELAELVYSNDFSTRKMVLGSVTRAAGRLAYQYDRDDGPDHWIRKNGSGEASFEAGATVRDDAGNQFLSLGRESGDGHTTFYTTSLGSAVSNGVVQITTDFRPPQNWFGAKGGSVELKFGNKLFEQSAVKNTAAGRILVFGFRDSTSSGNGGVYKDIRPYVLASADGEPVGTAAGTYSYLSDKSLTGGGKWYRFVVRANLDRGTYKARVYDMGTAHPTPDTPRGALVGNVTDLPFLNEVGDGLSTMGVSCYAVSSTPGETGDDPLHALVDNIEVKTVSSSMVIFVK